MSELCTMGIALKFSGKALFTSLKYNFHCWSFKISSNFKRPVFLKMRLV